MKALLPRSRRYCWPNCHSRLSARGTKSWITARPDCDLASTCSAEAGRRRVCVCGVETLACTWDRDMTRTPFKASLVEQLPDGIGQFGATVPITPADNQITLV